MLGQGFKFISAIMLFISSVLSVGTLQAADVKSAIIQFSDQYPNEVNRDADRLETYIREAAANGAKLIVAPENSLYRYDPWESEGVTALDLANSFTQIVDRFRDLALELQVCLVLGLREPSGDPAKPTYQSGVFIDHKGNLIHTYRKRVPSNSESRFTKAEGGWASFVTPVGRVFLQICKDMDGDGYIKKMPTDIDLLIGLNKDPSRGWVKVDAGAKKASCYAIGANYAGSATDTGGNSGFCGPDGKMISEAGPGNFGSNETIIYEILPLPADQDLLGESEAGVITLSTASYTVDENEATLRHSRSTK